MSASPCSSAPVAPKSGKPRRRVRGEFMSCVADAKAELPGMTEIGENRDMSVTDVLSPAEQAELRGKCRVFLNGHGAPRAADLLACIPGDTVTDRYGEGGVVTELEGEVA